MIYFVILFSYLKNIKLSTLQNITSANQVKQKEKSNITEDNNEYMNAYNVDIRDEAHINDLLIYLSDNKSEDNDLDMLDIQNLDSSPRSKKTQDRVDESLSSRAEKGSKFINNPKQHISDKNTKPCKVIQDSNKSVNICSAKKRNIDYHDTIKLHKRSKTQSDNPTIFTSYSSNNVFQISNLNAEQKNETISSQHSNNNDQKKNSNTLPPFETIKKSKIESYVYNEYDLDQITCENSTRNLYQENNIQNTNPSHLAYQNPHDVLFKYTNTQNYIFDAHSASCNNIYSTYDKHQSSENVKNITEQPLNEYSKNASSLIQYNQLLQHACNLERSGKLNENKFSNSKIPQIPFSNVDSTYKNLSSQTKIQDFQNKKNFLLEDIEFIASENMTQKESQILNEIKKHLLNYKISQPHYKKQSFVKTYFIETAKNLLKLIYLVENIKSTDNSKLDSILQIEFSPVKNVKKNNLHEKSSESYCKDETSNKYDTFYNLLKKYIENKIDENWVENDKIQKKSLNNLLNARISQKYKQSISLLTTEQKSQQKTKYEKFYIFLHNLLLIITACNNFFLSFICNLDLSNSNTDNFIISFLNDISKIDNLKCSRNPDEFFLVLTNMKNLQLHVSEDILKSEFFIKNEKEIFNTIKNFNQNFKAQNKLLYAKIHTEMFNSIGKNPENLSFLKNKTINFEKNMRDFAKIYNLIKRIKRDV